MSNICNLCDLLRIQSCDDDQPIDDVIKADARHQVSLVEGSNMMVDEYMGQKLSENNTINLNTGRQCHFRRPYRRFRGYCKKLFLNHQNSRVQCGLCKATIRTQEKYLMIRSSVNHACIHLGKMMFACAHCDNTYTCRPSIIRHLWNTHKMNTHPSNYTDSSARYEKEILEMLKRCYGNNPGSETVISGRTTRKQSFRHLNTNPLSNFCRKLVKPNKDGRVSCAICGSVLIVRRGSQSTSCIDHAHMHLQKPLFRCGQCHLQLFTKRAVQTHLTRVHVLSFRKENYTDMSSKFEKDTMDMLKRCFGQEKLVKWEPSDEPKRKGRFQVLRQLSNDPLSNACRKLFANLPVDAQVRCLLCGAEKKLFTTNQWGSLFQSGRFITHALNHLAKPVFKCRVCGHSTVARPAMQVHLRTCHKVAGSKANYVDDSPKYQKQVIAMLEKCFGQANTNVQVLGASKEQKGSTMVCVIRSRAPNDTLLAERNVRCYELTRKFEKFGKVTCRICKLEMVTEMAMRHIHNHLNRVMYHCRLCSHNTSTRSAIHKHVKRRHGQSSRNQYEDRSNDFHAQLLQLLSDCFDWDQESANGRAKQDQAIRCTSLIRGKSRGNDLKAARSLLCHQLAQKFAQGGRMSCRLCSASIVTAIGISVQFLYHAMTHLKVPRFQCRRCSKTANNKITIIQHLKKVHGSVVITDCENREDIFHHEIMKSLTDCFDWGQE